MDKATGKMLNYRQLLRHPKYSADWQLSSANEFGRLTNGVGGRVKGTTPSSSSRKAKYRVIANATSRMANLFAPFGPKNLNPTALVLWQAAIKLITREKSPHRQLTCLSPQSCSTASC
jgi:hypothetical protein